MNCPLVSPAAYLSPTTSGGGAAPTSCSLVGVLILSVLQNLINRSGTLSSYTQQMASGAFLIVVVTIQIYLTRTRKPLRPRKDLWTSRVFLKREPAC
jgi:ribose transport system permease protein